MNNIGGANVVILKRPTVEEADDNLEYHPTYPINAATRSQKKNLESKNFSPPHELQNRLEEILLEQTDLSRRFHEFPWDSMRFYAHALRRLQKILIV